jgi:hypothetical protein
LNTITWTKKIALTAACLCLSVASYAIPISGGIGIAGTSQELVSGIDFSNVGSPADGILDSNWSSTFVLVAEGDLAPLEISDDVFITDLAFDLSLPAGGIWLSNFSGFNFKVSTVVINDLANPLYKDYSGFGYLSLAGFDDTFAEWHYSSTNSHSYTLSIIPSDLPVDVPEPSALSLLVIAAAGFFVSLYRKRY